MRVISGSAKGYGLRAPRHMKLRPTPARVKEAIFSSLAARIPGAKVLELFAGTGAFSIETLSRGAASALMVEKDGRTVALIEENLRKTKLKDRAQILRADVRQALAWLQRDGALFDIIFADPPYYKEAASAASQKTSPHAHPKKRENHRKAKKRSFSWVSHLLTSPFLPPLLTPQGVLLIEHFKKDILEKSPYFEFSRDFYFGDTIISVFTHASHI